MNGTKLATLLLHKKRCITLSRVCAIANIPNIANIANRANIASKVGTIGAPELFRKEVKE